MCAWISFGQHFRGTFSRFLKKERRRIGRAEKEPEKEKRKQKKIGLKVEELQDNIDGSITGREQQQAEELGGIGVFGWSGVPTGHNQGPGDGVLPVL